MHFLQLNAEVLAFVASVRKPHSFRVISYWEAILMKSHRLSLAVSATLLLIGGQTACAGNVIEGTGAIVCVSDRWAVREPETGHKLVDYAGRCVFIPSDAAAEKATQECSGKFEYMPDNSYRASGTCTHTFKGGDKRFHAWEEGTHIKERGRFAITGGTGRLEGLRGSGTYALDELTDTLQGGTYTEKVELP